MFNSRLAKSFAHLSVRTFRWMRSPAAAEQRLYSGQDKLVLNDRNQIYINLNKTGKVWLMKSKAKLSSQAKGRVQIQLGSGVAGSRGHSADRASSIWGSHLFFFLDLSFFLLPSWPAYSRGCQELLSLVVHSISISHGEWLSSQNPRAETHWPSLGQLTRSVNCCQRRMNM